MNTKKHDFSELEREWKWRHYNRKEFNNQLSYETKLWVKRTEAEELAELRQISTKRVYIWLVLTLLAL